MNKTIHEQSVVVGVDVHKYSHTAVALDCWGQEKDSFEFNNDKLSEYAAWLSSLAKKNHLIIGLEDANGYGVHIVSALRRRGFPIRYVPAILTERDRRRSNHRDKSDYLDAKRVGKVILTKYEETLPAKESIANDQELKIATELDLLLAERRDLVSNKTAVKNQLHALLHRYYGDHYADGFPKAFHKKALKFYQKDLTNATSHGLSNINTLLAHSILRRIKRLVFIEKQITTIDKQLAAVGKNSVQVIALHGSIQGCGILTASVIMAELITIRRFNNKAKLAKYAGVAPTQKSSGCKDRLYTNPHGNRVLNKAIHTIALSQIACRGDKRGKKYYQKKLKEGKTKLWALRCLKRQLTNKVFKTLKSVKE